MVINMDSSQIVTENIGLFEQESTYEKALHKEIKSKWKRSLTAWLLLAPSLVFLTFFTIYPIIKSIISSFYIDNLSVMKPVFAGLANYVALFRDKVYWECFANNLLIAVITVPCSIALAIAMAMFANGLKWGKAVVRLGFTYLTFIPLVAAANIWMFIYTPIYGLLGYINPQWRFLAEGKSAIWSCWFGSSQAILCFFMWQDFMEFPESYLRQPRLMEQMDLRHLPR